jgi:hypothetical protein
MSTAKDKRTRCKQKGQKKKRMNENPCAPDNKEIYPHDRDINLGKPEYERTIKPINDI